LVVPLKGIFHIMWTFKDQPRHQCQHGMLIITFSPEIEGRTFPEIILYKQVTFPTFLWLARMVI
jgi:hypothetical protein